MRKTIVTMLSLPVVAFSLAAVSACAPSQGSTASSAFVEPDIVTVPSIQGSVERKANGHFYLDYEEGGIAESAPLVTNSVDVAGRVWAYDAEGWGKAMAFLVGEEVKAYPTPFAMTDDSHEYYGTAYSYKVILEVVFPSGS